MLKKFTGFFLFFFKVNFLSQKLKEAIDDFKIAVALNPKNPKAVVEKCFAEYRMALMNKDLNSISKIKKRFEKLIEEFPDCSECYILFALVR